MMGALLRETGRLQEALARHETARRLSPGDDYVFRNERCLASIGEGDVWAATDAAKAKKFYFQAIDDFPSLDNPYLSLWNLLVEKQKASNDALVEEFRRARDKHADSAVASQFLGNALKQAGKMDEAIACYHKATELDPNSVAAKQALSEALGGKSG